MKGQLVVNHSIHSSNDLSGLSVTAESAKQGTTLSVSESRIKTLKIDKTFSVFIFIEEVIWIIEIYDSMIMFQMSRHFYNHSW